MCQLPMGMKQLRTYVFSKTNIPWFIDIRPTINVGVVANAVFFLILTAQVSEFPPVSLSLVERELVCDQADFVYAQ